MESEIMKATQLLVDAIHSLQMTIVGVIFVLAAIAINNIIKK